MQTEISVSDMRALADAINRDIKPDEREAFQQMLADTHDLRRSMLTMWDKTAAHRNKSVSLSYDESTLIVLSIAADETLSIDQRRAFLSSFFATTGMRHDYEAIAELASRSKDIVLGKSPFEGSLDSLQIEPAFEYPIELSAAGKSRKLIESVFTDLFLQLYEDKQSRFLPDVAADLETTLREQPIDVLFAIQARALEFNTCTSFQSAIVAIHKATPIHPYMLEMMENAFDSMRTALAKDSKLEQEFMRAVMLWPTLDDAKKEAFIQDHFAWVGKVLGLPPVTATVSDKAEHGHVMPVDNYKVQQPPIHITLPRALTYEPWRMLTAGYHELLGHKYPESILIKNYGLQEGHPGHRGNEILIRNMADYCAIEQQDTIYTFQPSEALAESVRCFLADSLFQTHPTQFYGFVKMFMQASLTAEKMKKGVGTAQKSDKYIDPLLKRLSALPNLAESTSLPDIHAGLSQLAGIYDDMMSTSGMQKALGSPLRLFLLGRSRTALGRIGFQTFVARDLIRYQVDKIERMMQLKRPVRSSEQLTALHSERRYNLHDVIHPL